MIDNPERGVRSTASIGGHPIHPMLVPLPIGFLIGTLGADIGFWATGDAFWARAALWLVGAGVVSAALAAVFGFTDFATIKRVRETNDAWIHLLGNGLALLVAIWNWAHRIGDPAASVLPLGIILSLVTVGILTVTGWYGGELAYRHKIGVIEPESEPGYVAGDGAARPSYGTTMAADPAMAGSKPRPRDPGITP
jgi:uncharacterized membrane protein